jgi:hypothetical protein
MRTCRDKGFDGVEADNVNGFQNPTGFGLTRGDQLAFNAWIANRAHALGLSAGLKNDLDQASQLEPYFDLAVVEQCVQYRECAKTRAFVAAGKPVLDVEYSLPRSAFCSRTRKRGLAAIRKHLALGTWRRTCG